MYVDELGVYEHALIVECLITSTLHVGTSFYIETLMR